MEPIGSTYGSTPPAAYSGGAPLRAEADRRVNQDAGADKQGTVSSSPAPQDYATNRQLGVQLSGDSGREEFKAYGPDGTRKPDTPEGSAPKTDSKDSPAALPGEKKQEDPQVQQQVAQLKSTEEKVKAHEAAHKAAGGAMTGPISYTYTRGPDGKSYITGGEVPISVSPGKTPQETVSRMQQVIQAALAPADPSSQDRAVAAQAAQEMQKAQQQRTSSTTADGGQASGASAETSGTNAATASTKNTSDAATAATTAPGERRTRSETAGNGLSSQVAKAYGDPSVTGKGEQSRTIPSSGLAQSGVEGTRPGVPPRETRQTDAALIPAMITGFDPSQPVSFYA